MRLEHAKEFPAASRALRQAADALKDSGLEPGLKELVYLRASQINGCSFCVDMHARAARAGGEEERRLHLVAAWREAQCFTARERAALAWTEAVTLVSQTHVPDDVYQEASRQFSPSDLVALTLAVVIINGWNRLQIAFRVAAPEPGPPA